jgi:hypothetical protein
MLINVSIHEESFEKIGNSHERFYMFAHVWILKNYKQFSGKAYWCVYSRRKF